MNEKLQRVRKIIHDEVGKGGFKVCRILLFGSRVRGTVRPDSDWDFYVIIDRDLGFRSRNAIGSKIRWRLSREEDMDADVFVQAETTVRERMEDTGYLTYYVMKGGVPL